jgi:hypothetical protein
MIFLVSTPLKAKTPSHQQKKTGSTWKTLKPLSIHTQNLKVRNLLHFLIEYVPFSTTFMASSNIWFVHFYFYFLGGNLLAFGVLSV